MLFILFSFLYTSQRKLNIKCCVSVRCKSLLIWMLSKYKKKSLRCSCIFISNTLNNFNWRSLMISPMNNESYLALLLSVFASINVLSCVKEGTCNTLRWMCSVNKWSNSVESNVRYILLTQLNEIKLLDDNEIQKERT